MLHDRTISYLPIFFLAMGPLYLSINTLVLGLTAAVFMVLMVSINVLVLYPLRNLFPARLRLIVLLILNGSLVTLLYTLLQAHAFPLQQQLGLFLPLVCINSLVLSYAEHVFKAASLRMFLPELLTVLLLIFMSLVLFGAVRELLGNFSLLSDVNLYLGINLDAIRLLERPNGLALFDSAAGVVLLLGFLSALLCAVAKRFSTVE